MMPSLKTAKGVSSCGGRADNPINGRLPGYVTSGRSPLAKGSVTVSAAKAAKGDPPISPAPKPTAAPPADFSIWRLLISMAFLPRIASGIGAFQPAHAVCEQVSRKEFQSIQITSFPASLTSEAGESYAATG